MDVVYWFEGWVGCDVGYYVFGIQVVYVFVDVGGCQVELVEGFGNGVVVVQWVVVD